MNTQDTTLKQPTAYAAPIVRDGGAAKAVTRGRNGFDVQDRTEYRQK